MKANIRECPAWMENFAKTGLIIRFVLEPDVNTPDICSPIYSTLLTFGSVSDVMHNYGLCTADHSKDHAPQPMYLAALLISSVPVPLRLAARIAIMDATDTCYMTFSAFVNVFSVILISFQGPVIISHPEYLHTVYTGLPSDFKTLVTF